MITNVGGGPTGASDRSIPGRILRAGAEGPAAGTGVVVTSLWPMSGRLRRACALVLPLLVLAAACTDDGASPNASAETTAPPPPPTAPPTTLPPGGRQPTAQDPLRVTFAGDSVMAEFAPAMIQALEGTGESVGRFI